LVHLEPPVSSLAAVVKRAKLEHSSVGGVKMVLSTYRTKIADALRSIDDIRR